MSLMACLITANASSDYANMKCTLPVMLYNQVDLMFLNRGEIFKKMKCEMLCDGIICGVHVVRYLFRHKSATALNFLRICSTSFTAEHPILPLHMQFTNHHTVWFGKIRRLYNNNVPYRYLYFWSSVLLQIIAFMLLYIFMWPFHIVYVFSSYRD